MADRQEGLTETLERVELVRHYARMLWAHEVAARRFKAIGDSRGGSFGKARDRKRQARGLVQRLEKEQAKIRSEARDRGLSVVDVLRWVVVLQVEAGDYDGPPSVAALVAGQLGGLRNVAP